MDSEDLSSSLLIAGQEYLEALRRLRLNPEGLLWARANEIRHIQIQRGDDTIEGVDDYPGGEWHLVLVTSAVDEAGPSVLNDLLFKAYDASATPREISPFIVEVISATSPFVLQLLNAMNSLMSPSLVAIDANGREMSREDNAFTFQTMIAGLWFDRKWVYHLTGLNEQTSERKRHWQEFRQSVNDLAA